ncbi:hypothetical protein QYE76_059638 [Lolium multiflorum]|uniref:Uncharacterized protein n=1 Tax=Lolium multiflorum TaxID=4521 RepID=A0AAD8RZ19_LOLMU|nr:hypothetical protein QYE76_059638 [Lolium multiflorum]
MKRFIVELGVVPSALDPLIIYFDNMGAIANAQEPRSHKRLKHIKLRYHSIREYIEDGEVKICKVHTDLNVADPLTKALPRAKHDQHQNAMGVRNPSKEIFSELDEINAQVSIFTGSIQNTRKDQRGGTGPGTIGRRGPAPPRRLWCRRLRPLRRFAYLKPPDGKPDTFDETTNLPSRRHREAKIWGTGVSVPAPCRSGEVPQEGFSIDTAAISTAIFITACSHEEGVIHPRG